MSGIIEIKAPDGTVIRFPDGTSDETIKSVMQKNYGSAPKPGVMSRLWTSIAGNDADPNIPALVKSNLGLPAAQAAQMTALLATTRSPDRLRSGIAKIEPDAEFGEDESGRLFAVMPSYKDGKKTGQFKRVYPNEPGLGFVDLMQGAGAVAAAAPIGRAFKALGLPVTGKMGAAAIGATEAAIVEGASSQLSGAPFQVTDIPIGAAGGVAGEKLMNVVGGLVSAARRSGADRVLDADGNLLPDAAEFVRRAGLDPADVSARVAADIQKQVRGGIDPESAGIRAQAQSLPVDVPMTQGQITGSKGQQLSEDAMSSGAMGSTAERQMQGFRTEQQDALRENVTAISEGLAPGSPPVQKGGGGELAQEALVAARAGDKARANDLYAQARASGAAVIEPDEALDFADAARATYREGFDPITAPKMDKLLLRLDEIMGNGADIKELQTWRRQVSGLRAGAPDTEGAAAGSVLRLFDDRLKAAVDNQLLIGDQASVDAWRNAISNWSEYASTWESKGGILNLLTEKTTRDGARQLKVAPQEAGNAIFTMTASGLASKTKLPRDLVTLKGRLPTAEWNALRQEAFIRLTDTAEGAFRGDTQQVSGVNFKKAWGNLKKNNPGVVNTLFSKAERDTISQFADVAARATNTAVNASNSANAAAGMIQRLASGFTASGPGQFIIQNHLAQFIREPLGAARAVGATSQAQGARQILGTPRQLAVGAGTGAALSQEENIGPNIPITGRMSIGTQQ